MCIRDRSTDAYNRPLYARNSRFETDSVIRVKYSVGGCTKFVKAFNLSLSSSCYQEIGTSCCSCWAVITSHYTYWSK